MPENKKFKYSDFVSTALLNDDIKDRANREYINPIVDNFLKTKGIFDYEEIKPENSISDLDFKNIEFKYFYDELIYDIRKNDIGNLEVKTKFIVSFDKNLCDKFCQKSSTYYQHIKINRKVLAYFIFIDFHDLISYLRN